jgi:Ca2+-binding RTX toxin-like protein
VTLTPDMPKIGEGGMELRVGGLLIDANGESRTLLAEEPLEITWSNAASFVLNQEYDSVVEGGGCTFSLQLRSADGSRMTCNENLVLVFSVAAAAGLFEETPDGPVTWRYDPDLYSGSGGYTVTATLAAGADTLALDVHPLGGTDGIIGSNNASLSFELANIRPEDAGSALQGLGADILMDGDPIGPIGFDVVDAESHFLQEQRIITGHEADGMLLVLVDGSNMYDGSDAATGQVIMGTDGDDIIYAGQHNDIIYAGQGNNTLISGNGEDIFVWNNASMGLGDSGKTDIISDFDWHNDILRFDDLFSGAENANEALDNLLYGLDGGSISWQDNTFTAEFGTTAIRLNIDDAAASLKVSYEHEGQQYTQNVTLQGFDAAQHFADVQTAAEIAEMLQQILKVGGNT